MKKTLIGLLGSTVICVLFLAGCIGEQHKGTVSVESSTGKGSTFTLKIPE